MNTSICVRTQFEALHRWIEAPEAVSFLKDYHRHMFVVRLEIEVRHDDRELEFILVKRALEKYLDTLPKMSNLSCEQIAKRITNWATDLYGSRAMTCGVFEDGENGSIVTL